MGCKMLCIIGLIFFGFCHVNARVFYVEGPPTRNPSASRTSYGYPMIYRNEESELQANRDLDLSFTAGDTGEINENRDNVFPARKVYAYATPERPLYEIKGDYERPLMYYKVTDVPTRRIVYDDQYPTSNRKFVKINGNNGPHKGEVVMELRVIASNNDNNNGI